MSDTIVLPSPDEIELRIRACREELAALKRLHRLTLAAQTLRAAENRRLPLRQEEGHESEAVHAH